MSPKISKVLTSASLLATLSLLPVGASAAATPQILANDGYLVRYEHNKASFYNKSASEGYANVWRAARDNWNNTAVFKWTETTNVNSRTFTSSQDRSDGEWATATGITYSRTQIDATNPAWQTGAEIYLNRYNLNLFKYTLAEKKTVATHEMGHGLGLAHNPENASVMYYAARNQSIINDDIQGALNIYASARLLQSDAADTEVKSVINPDASMHIDYVNDYTGEEGIGKIKNDSELTVIGEVTSSQEVDDNSTDSPSHYTKHTLSVGDTLKGTAVDTVDFYQAGTKQVSDNDSKALSDGDRVLITLKKDPQGNWFVLNNGQGLFISNDTTKDARSTETFTRASDGRIVTADLMS